MKRGKKRPYLVVLKKGLGTLHTPQVDSK